MVGPLVDRSDWADNFAGSGGSMERPVDREDFKAFVMWWYTGAIPREIPDHIREALDHNDPEMLDKSSAIWNVWWQHRFGQNPNSQVYRSSKDQIFVGSRGGLYKITASGRRYM